MNEQPTGKDLPNSRGHVWGERLVAALVGGVLTSAALLWTSAKETSTREFEVRTQRETAVRNLQGQLLNTLSAMELSPEDDFAKVVFLGALHGNFSAQFDTRTVFEAYAQEVKDPVARRELRRLAERVSRRQSEYIKAHGGEGTRCSLNWTGEVDSARVNPIRIAGHSMFLSLTSEPIRRWESKRDFRNYVERSQNSDEFEEQIIARQTDDDDLGVDDVADVAEVWLRMERDEDRGRFAFLKDLFKSEEHGESEAWCGKSEVIEVSEDLAFEGTFELAYMDSPYIDNIWIPHDDSADRIAVLLRGIDKCREDSADCLGYLVEVEILHFPDDLLVPVEQAPPEEVVSGQHGH